MSNAADDQKLFKLILAAIASETLSSEDYQVALSSLRDGKMIAIVEQILGALASPQTPLSPRKEKGSDKASEKNQKSRKHGSKFPKSPDDLVGDIKRRKINRERLESILASVDRQFLETVDPNETVRFVINRFKDRASDRQWQLLDSIVNGSYEVDPYLSNTP